MSYMESTYLVSFLFPFSISFSHCLSLLSLSFPVSDGVSTVITRYIDNPDREPASMYFSQGTEFKRSSDGVYRMSQRDRCEDVVIVASERLTSVREDWVCVPKNSMVTVTPRMSLLLKPIPKDLSSFLPGEPSA